MYLLLYQRQHWETETGSSIPKTKKQTKKNNPNTKTCGLRHWWQVSNLSFSIKVVFTQIQNTSRSTTFAWFLVAWCPSNTLHPASQEQICWNSCTCCCTEIEVADQTFYLTKSQYTDIQHQTDSASQGGVGRGEGVGVEGVIFVSTTVKVVTSPPGQQGSLCSTKCSSIHYPKTNLLEGVLSILFFNLWKLMACIPMFT